MNPQLYTTYMYDTIYDTYGFQFHLGEGFFQLDSI